MNDKMFNDEREILHMKPGKKRKLLEIYENVTPSSLVFKSASIKQMNPKKKKSDNIDHAQGLQVALEDVAKFHPVCFLFF